MRTERQYRESEQLVSVEDYLNEINLLIEMSEDMEGSKSTNYIDKTIILLCKALNRKEKYKLRFSRRWRKSQGFFSRWKDVRAERREIKREEAEEKEVDVAPPQRIDSSSEEGDMNEVQTENEGSLVVTQENEVLKF